MSYHDIIDRLQEEQNKICESFTPKQQKKITRAINIEYKLTMVEEGHYSELDDEGTEEELSDLEEV